MLYAIKLYHVTAELSIRKCMSMDILVWIFGVGAMISLFAGYQQKTRVGLLAAKLCADAFWVAHYLCLGALAGMIPNFVGIFREIVFINRKRHRWASLAVWPIFFIAFNWVLGFSTFDSAIDLLPITASTAVTAVLWIDRPVLTKIILVPVSLSFLIYDVFVGSYIGIVNESIGIASIILFFIKNYNKKGEDAMQKKVFSDDNATSKELYIAPGARISDVARTISANVDGNAIRRGDAFANEISERFVADFEKKEDKMAHVSTFIVVDGVVYMTYYANTKEPSEDPKNQTARLAYAPIDDMSKMVYLDIQTPGTEVGGRVVDMVYDTILMQKDVDTLYVMWTARVEGNYYRFYCPFTLSTKSLGEIGVNRFKIGDTVNDFSVSGIRAALAENDLPCKKMYSDIGIMQKLSSRVENGERYYYSGTYSGDFSCIIKSRDLITWEYVAQPDFINDSKWENATYVVGDKCYYFVRQQDDNKCGFLTAYDLERKTWDRAVEIEDCQSRGDFIEYGGKHYLFHAPIDREHIGIVEIDTENIANSRVVLQAKMHTSCFYPFVQYYEGGELAMSYTIARKHIRLARFTLSDYLK